MTPYELKRLTRARELEAAIALRREHEAKVQHHLCVHRSWWRLTWESQPKDSALSLISVLPLDSQAEILEFIMAKIVEDRQRFEAELAAL
jgi:hypothetical protein